MQQDPSELKQTLRSQMRKKRRGLTHRTRMHASRHIIQSFLSSIPLRRNDIIAGYSPLPEEIDISLLYELITEEGYRVAMPVITGHGEPLKFRNYTPYSELKMNKDYNTLEPTRDEVHVTPNVVITPMLAFDISGNRLGFGGGFYDRTLSKLRSETDGEIFTIGVAYDFQKIERVPSQEHDEKLDCILTEERIYITNERKDRKFRTM